MRGTTTLILGFAILLAACVPFTAIAVLIRRRRKMRTKGLDQHCIERSGVTAEDFVATDNAPTHPPIPAPTNITSEDFRMRSYRSPSDSGHQPRSTSAPDVPRAPKPILRQTQSERPRVLAVPAHKPKMTFMAPPTPSSASVEVCPPSHTIRRKPLLPPPNDRIPEESPTPPQYYIPVPSPRTLERLQNQSVGSRSPSPELTNRESTDTLPEAHPMSLWMQQWEREHPWFSRTNGNPYTAYLEHGQEMRDVERGRGTSRRVV